VGPELAAGKRSIRLARRFAEEMIAHARQGAPDEVCGILALSDDRVTRVYRGRNVAEDPAVRYQLEPDEQFRLLQELGALGEADDRPFGIYHSHPAGPAFPSPTDVMMAFWPQATHFIVSLAGAEPVIRAFRIDWAEGRAAADQAVTASIQELQVVID
jgi:proteasome lid subunit RPN8/RPN11